MGRIADRRERIQWPAQPTDASRRFEIDSKGVIMAQVDGIGGVDGPRRILGESLRRMAKMDRPPDKPADEVEISEAARRMAALSQVPGVRMELVQRVREEILSGTYETPEKWDVALPRLLEDLLGRTER
jgi:hypothetical protein